MTKKEQRKTLELLLVKTIEEVLNKRNTEASKKIRKTTYDASKLVAKKFYKSIKEKQVTKQKTKPKSTKKPKPKTKIKAASLAPIKKAKNKK